PSTTCGPETPSPSANRPPDRWSSVMVLIAVAVGVRADSCTTAVDRRMFSVSDPYQASGVNASEPQASAVKTVSKPALSAATTRCAGVVGGGAPQHPSGKANFMPTACRTPPAPRVPHHEKSHTVERNVSYLRV